MLGLIKNRTQDNVNRSKYLSSLGWEAMSEAQRAEWSGDPFSISGANLFSDETYYSTTVEMVYRNEYFTATATTAGTYLYAIVILGEAAKFSGNTYTLSVGDISPGAGTPHMAFYWHDDGGYDHTGYVVDEAGTQTITFWENTNNRAYLAAYIYVTTDTAVSVGDSVTYTHVMLTAGSEAAEYVPYTPIVTTEATKGCYNYSDLRRVEKIVDELAVRYGLALTTKTDWGKWDIPTKADSERYLGNILAIRDAAKAHVVLPEAPSSMDAMTYSNANTIETILDLACQCSNAMVRAGDIYVGEA